MELFTFPSSQTYVFLDSTKAPFNFDFCLNLSLYVLFVIVVAIKDVFDPLMVLAWSLNLIPELDD